MSTDVDGLHEQLEEQFRSYEDEIEHVVPTCDTCLLMRICKFAPYGPDGVQESCVRFVPTAMDGCVFINGEWYS
jgi:hypothetical protein